MVSLYHGKRRERCSSEPSCIVCMMKRYIATFRLRLRAQKAPVINYSLDKAREYWQYAPDSLASTKRTTRKLLNQPDHYVREFMWRSIEARNSQEGAMDYRTRVLELIRRREVKSLLDFGCGMGQDSVYFATKCSRALKVTFADIVESNVRLVSSYARVFNINSNAILVKDPENESFPSAYDLIWANGVLHHTPRARQIVLNLKRYVEPNGLFVCMLYTPKHFESSHAKNLREYAFLSEGKLPKSSESIHNPYSDFYDKAKAERLFEDFEMLDHFTTGQGGFGWYVLTPRADARRD